MAPKDAQQEKTARRSSKRLASEALDSGSSGPHKSMRTEPLAEETGGPKSSRASSSAADKQKETRETAAAAVAEEEEVEADAPAAAAAKGKGKGKGKKAPAAAAAKKGKDKGKGKASSKPTRNQPKRGGKQQPQQQEQEQSEAEEEEQELTGLDKEAAEKITTLPPDEYADWHVGHFYKPVRGGGVEQALSPPVTPANPLTTSPLPPPHLPAQDIKLHRTPQHFYLHWEFARFRAIKAQGLPQDSDYLDPDDLFTHFTVRGRY